MRTIRVRRRECDGLAFEGLSFWPSGTYPSFGTAKASPAPLAVRFDGWCIRDLRDRRRRFRYDVRGIKIVTLR